MAGGSDRAHLRVAGWSGLGLGALLALLCLTTAGGLAAQSRGDMQVGAQVLPAGPSQAALASALHQPANAGQSDLAEVSRELRRAAPDSTGLARRPRSVVTITFLRN